MLAFATLYVISKKSANVTVANRRFRSLTLIVSVSSQQFWENGGRLPSSAVAGRSRLGRGRWSQLFPRVCRSPRICRGHSSTRGRLGRISSWRRPLPGSDAEECRLWCCSSPAHRGGSNKQRFSFRGGQRFLWCVRGSVPAGRAIFLELHGKRGVRKRLSWLA